MKLFPIDGLKPPVQLYKTVDENLRYLVQSGMKGATELHVGDDVGSLPFIRSNDTHLFRFDTSSQKACSNLFNSGSFSSRKKVYLLSLPEVLNRTLVAYTNVEKRAIFSSALSQQQ